MTTNPYEPPKCSNEPSTHAQSIKSRFRVTSLSSRVFLVGSLIAWLELLFLAILVEEPFAWTPTVGWPFMCGIWYAWISFGFAIYRAHPPLSGTFPFGNLYPRIVLVLFDKYVPIAMNTMLCLLPLTMAVAVPILVIANPS